MSINKAECPFCLTDKCIRYSFLYDSYYCSFCERWIDPICFDPVCKYCKDRPEKPIDKEEESAYNISLSKGKY